MLTLSVFNAAFNSAKVSSIAISSFTDTAFATVHTLELVFSASFAIVSTLPSVR